MKKLLANYTKRNLAKHTSSVNFSEIEQSVGLSPNKNYKTSNRSMAPRDYLNRSMLLDSVNDRDTMAGSTQRSHTKNIG
jgi:hypothetical protein